MTAVVARRGRDLYLVRDDAAGTDRVLDVRRRRLSPAMRRGAWVKDAYWQPASMDPDELMDRMAQADRARKYSEGQPREPAGSPEGGQFAGGGPSEETVRAFGTDRHAAEQFMADRYRSVWETLNGLGQRAVNNYASYNYQLINAIARGQEIPSEIDARLMGERYPVTPELVATAREDVAILRDVIDKAPPLDEAQVVYRSFVADQFGTVRQGDIVQDRGFVSTSVLRTSAMMAASPTGRPIGSATIRLPAGTRVGQTGRNSMEMILQAGSRFRVDGGEGNHLELTWLGAERMPESLWMVDQPSPVTDPDRYRWAGRDLRVVSPATKAARPRRLASGGIRRDQSLNPIIARVRDQLLALVADQPIRKWDESDHPREPAGSSDGGQFTDGGGSSEFAATTATMTRYRDMGEARAAEVAADRQAAYDRLKDLSISELHQVRGRDSVDATLLWRERMGIRLDKEEERNLGIMRGDPKAEVELARQLGLYFKDTQPEKASAEFRNEVSDATGRLFGRADVQAVLDHVGMREPGVYVTSERYSGIRPYYPDQDTPQAEWMGSIYVYDATSNNNAVWGNVSGDKAEYGPGSVAIGSATMDDMLMHELGHGVHAALDASGLGGSGIDGWRDLYRTYQTEANTNFQTSKDYVSYYSLQNDREGFADVFALVMRGGYDKDDYSPSARAVIDFVEAAIR